MQMLNKNLKYSGDITKLLTLPESFICFSHVFDNLNSFKIDITGGISG